VFFADGGFIIVLPGFSETELVQIDVDFDSKVNVGCAHQRRQPAEMKVRIGLTVADNNIFAAPAQQFDGGQIFKVPAVGEVDPVICFVELAGQLPQEG
jgi:hypothetical protein